jgi:hypothetical protein
MSGMSEMSEMSDAEFVRAFLDGALSPHQFHHRDHLRLAWYLARERGADEAGPLIATAIRDFAARHGHAEKYHETMTRFWVRAVAHHVAARPNLSDFDGFLAAFPPLLDTGLPYRHWSREAMASAGARAGWVEPDLLALPA